MQDHRNLQTIYVGHEQVRYHESGGNLSELAEPFLTVGCLSDHNIQQLPAPSEERHGSARCRQ
jgi:hypothetical protein